MSEPNIREFYWYVLAAYLFAIGFGAALVLGMVGLTNRLTLISVGTFIILVILGLASFATFPALYKDAQYLRKTDEWNPRWWVYAAGGVLTPIFGYFTGGFLFSPQVNIFLSVLSWLGSIATMCTVYLYRRHGAVGIP